MLCSCKRLHNGFSLICLLLHIKWMWKSCGANWTISNNTKKYMKKLNQILTQFGISDEIKSKDTYRLCFSTIKFSFCKVTPCEIKPAHWSNAIPTTTSTFLIVWFQTFWAAIVYYISYVRLINTHAKSNSSNHDIEFISDKWSRQVGKSAILRSIYHVLVDFKHI